MEENNKIHILIVDDIPANLIVLEHSLNNPEYTIIKASSGAKGLELLLEYDFALAILDVQMPEMSGFEMAELMKKNTITKNIPVIFLTASVDTPAKIKKGYQSGAVDFIPKPFDQLILNSKISVFVELYKQRKKTELIIQKLENNKQELIKYQMAIESTSEAIGISTPSGKHIFHNKAFSDLFGYKTAEDLDKNGGGIVLYSDKKIANNVFETIMQGKSWQGEVFMYNRDNKQIPVFVKADAIKDENDNIIAVVGTHSDITEQRHFENELEKAIERANKMALKAEIADVSKSEFLANMSHEIRTPLNGVVGMIDLLFETDLTSEQKEYAEAVIKSADALLEIINDILDYSKIEAGKLDIETIDFNLAVTIEDVCELLAVKAFNGGNELSGIILHNIPQYLKGDPGRLRQILINLTGNAVKFTENGEISINVSVMNETENNVTLKFEITDTGIGIPKNRINSIFESFSQVDTSTTRKYGGTGLGLAISKQISSLMGGDIGVESKEGEGTTFWFTANFEKQKIIPDTFKIVKDIIDKKILIVGNTSNTRKVIYEILKRFNLISEEAESAETALKTLKYAADINKPFSLVIIDKFLGETDGSELGKKIKETENIKDTIMILSALPKLKGNLSELIEAGFTEYLSKPVKQVQLIKTIKIALSPEIKDEYEYDNKNISFENKSFSNLKIILAEDNKMNQKVASKMLKKMGHLVTIAENGLEALKLHKNNDFDLIIMDNQMPVMDGTETTIQIRRLKDKTKQTIPIIALTANAMKSDRKKFIDAGMNDYIAKPVKRIEMEKIISKCLNKVVTDSHAAKSDSS